ncbi:MAG TPA: GNAT family N-acetyltransferase [Thermoanaerobaculia bacterium]|nr:GNAT family N-acetyltransferase [Thermoanaerobaculia bacterium]
MIEQLAVPVSDDDVRDLALLLLDATAAGASVGFLDSLTLESAQRWWRENLAGAGVVLVARDDAGIVGTVQLRPAPMPNQRHRADVAKLLVHRRARRQGLGGMLMKEIERRARSAGFTLLTLDTKRGDAAESLYRRAGWTEVGVIPGYALNPDGSMCDTVVFYKAINE